MKKTMVTIFVMVMSTVLFGFTIDRNVIGAGTGYNYNHKSEMKTFMLPTAFYSFEGGTDDFGLTADLDYLNFSDSIKKVFDFDCQMRNVDFSIWAKIPKTEDFYVTGEVFYTHTSLFDVKAKSVELIGKVGKYNMKEHIASVSSYNEFKKGLNVEAGFSAEVMNQIDLPKGEMVIETEEDAIVVETEAETIEPEKDKYMYAKVEHGFFLEDIRIGVNSMLSYSKHVSKENKANEVSARVEGIKDYNKYLNLVVGADLNYAKQDEFKSCVLGFDAMLNIYPIKNLNTSIGWKINKDTEIKDSTEKDTMFMIGYKYYF